MDEKTPPSQAPDLASRLGALAHDATESAYEPAHLDALWVDIERRTTRKRPTWALVAAACAACLVTGGLASWAIAQRGATPAEQQVAQQRVAQQPTAATPPVHHEGRMELPDGSLALALDDATQLAWTRDDAGTTVTLDEGAAVFDVAAQPEGQSFRVLAGDAEVEVIGTRFTVTHLDEGVEVDVAYGRVAVHAPDRQTVLLGAGESTVIGDAPVVALGDATPADDPNAQPPTSPEPPVESPEPPAAAKAPSVDSLLDRADAARRRGDHKAAARALQTVLDEHAKDPQAPLAAYTLGRIQLSDLDQPKRAAKSFGRARALAPKGTMAQDALAKEIESWAAAGNDAKAQTAADLYLERYPDGRWTKLAQRYAAH